MRHSVTALLAVHGILHLPGFLKAWHLAARPQLTGRTLLPLTPGVTRAVGVVWLAGAVVIVAAAGLRVLHRDTWGGLALVAIAVSQVLVDPRRRSESIGTLLTKLWHASTQAAQAPGPEPVQSVRRCPPERRGSHRAASGDSPA